MDANRRIDRALHLAIASACSTDGPPRLAAAMRHAVFPGGARVRPQLCLAVAHACDDRDDLTLAASAGAAIELLHCASLVHDDLPCFDAAEIRRGRPSVHSVFGAPLAVLAGDALIVLAFDVIASAGAKKPERLAPLLSVIARSVGAPHGIVAGQAWESEPEIDVRHYQRSKTGALFVAATMAGAVASGAAPGPWRRLGDLLGEAYQVADDIRDIAETATETGKPAGQDARNGRPNVVNVLGLDGALEFLDKLIADAAESIPPCDEAAALRDLVLLQAKRLTPKHLARTAA